MNIGDVLATPRKKVNRESSRVPSRGHFEEKKTIRTKAPQTFLTFLPPPKTLAESP